MTVFAWDNGNNTVVRIEKRGTRWCIYGLEKLDLRGKYPHFEFSIKPIESYLYQPFEPKDIKGCPDTFVDDVKRWQPQLVCH